MQILADNQHTQIIKGRHGYYALNTHSPIGRALQVYGEHGENEISFIKQFITEGSTVFDIGAHQGTHTLAFARLVGSKGRVVAFEPQRTMHQLAAATVALNELFNVRLYNYAVGNSECTVQIPIFDYTQRAHFSGMSVTNQPDGEKVPQIKIDDLALDLDLTTNVSLVKIDVEGMEYQVLTGAEKLLSSSLPVIYFELHEGNKHYSKIVEFLKGLSYRLFLHVPRGFNPDNYYKHPEDTFRGGVDRNCVAIPAHMQNIPECVRELKEV